MSASISVQNVEMMHSVNSHRDVSDQEEYSSNQEESILSFTRRQKDEETERLRMTPHMRRKDYESSLRALKAVAFVKDTVSIINGFLVLCALTWASAVLLGAYVQQLTEWHFFEVPGLLLAEGLRIGLVAFHRAVGYRLPNIIRQGLLAAEIILPLGMSGFAVLGIIPDHKRDAIRHDFFRHSKISNALTSSPSSKFSASLTQLISSSAPIPLPPPPPPPGPFNDMRVSLQIFYDIIIFNALVLVLEFFITSFMNYILRITSTAKSSLRNYYDKMVQGNGSWLRVGVDLDFGFKMQSFDYKRGSSAKEVCKMYTDLVWYLYVHEGGFEAAEAAMANSDSYVRQAAANMVGFWAVLESLEEVEGCRLPLRFQNGLLSKLADIAANSYGPTGTAAACSIALLLKSDPVGMVTGMHSQSGQGLVAILLKRVTQLLPMHQVINFPLGQVLQEESRGHIHALRKLLFHLKEPPPVAAAQQRDRHKASTFTEAQKVEILTEMQQSFGTDPASTSMSRTSIGAMIESLDGHLATLVAGDEADYHSEIRDVLVEPPERRRSRFKSLAKFLLLYVCSFLGGFFLGALIDHN